MAVFDLDDVLIDHDTSYWVEYYKRKGTPIEESKRYGLLDYSDEDRRYVMETMFKDPVFMCYKVSPSKFYIDILHYLDNLGYSLVVISSRFSEIHLETKRMVDKFFPDIFSDILLVNSDCKSGYVETLGAEFWFEDNPNFFKTIPKCIKKVFVEDRIYNRNITTDSRGKIHRVFSKGKDSRFEGKLLKMEIMNAN